MLTLQIKYDAPHDILYAHYPDCLPSYGDESEDGTVTFYAIDTDEITGMAVYDFKHRYNKGLLDFDNLPLPIDPNCGIVRGIIS